MSDFDFSAHKVLLCDVDPDAMDMVRTSYLEKEIGDFVATPSPAQAIEHLPKMQPNLILLALKFPDTNGIEIVRQIRALNDGAFFKTPIILLLEKVSQNLLREACRAGIEGALRKPIDREKLLRFTRAVILKPRRFICVAKYFGPERRTRDDPHFDGEDRRNSMRQSDYNLDSYTRTRPVGGVTLSPSQESSGGARGAVLSTESGSRSSASASTPDWGASKTRAEKSGTMQFDTDDIAPEQVTSPNGDYDLIETPAVAPTDVTPSKDTPTPSPVQVKATPQTTADSAALVEKTPEKPKTQQAPEPVQAGPDSDDFEEILDLDDCLDLHKEWVNSGGRSGQQAKRPNSDFRGQQIAEADFTKAILPQSNFEGVNCTSTVFRKADLSGSTFRNALMSSADLRVSRLTKADMRNSRLDKANMLGTDLSEANLEGATLRGVNLSGANLTRANLRGVNLASTQGLIHEQIRRAITDSKTRLPASLKATS